MGQHPIPAISRGTPANSGARHGIGKALAAELQRLGAYVFSHGYVHAMRWTMVLPISVVALAAASCVLVKRDVGPARGPVPREESGQLAGTISSPGSSGQNPGSSSGTGS